MTIFLYEKLLYINFIKLLNIYNRNTKNKNNYEHISNY